MTTNIQTANALIDGFFIYEPDTNSTCFEDTTEKALEATSYKRSLQRSIIYYALCIATGFIFALLCWWFPLFAFRFRCHKCTAELAEYFLLTTVIENGKKCKRIVKAIHTFVADQALHNIASSNIPYKVADDFQVVLFDFRCKRFILSDSGKFQELYFEVALPYQEIQQLGLGLSDPSTIEQRRQLYGDCYLNVPLTPILTILITELLHPFYLFQIGAVILWMCDEYYYYASAIIFTSVLFTTLQLVKTRQNENRLHGMCSSSCDVNVLLSDGLLDTQSSTTAESSPVSLTMANSTENAFDEWLQNRVVTYTAWQISSHELVPGHVFEITMDTTLPCDAILLSGAVIVNESALTGESTPVLKTAMPRSSDDATDDKYDISMNATSTLYAGTQVVAVKTSNIRNVRVTALVIRTGFATAQGSMMRTILHPPKTNFTFYRDSLYFLGVLLIIAIIGGIATALISARDSLSTKETVLRCLDLLTVLVPPSLPAVLTCAATISITALYSRWKVVCISPTKINVAGQVNTFVFDKTGTLTSSELELEGLLPVEIGIQLETDAKNECDIVLTTNVVRNVRLSSVGLTQAIATCNSISVVDGQLIGESLEKLLVEFSGWTLQDEAAVTATPLEVRSHCITVGETVNITDTEPGKSMESDVYMELQNASKAKIMAALLNVYDCDITVPVTARPPKSEGVLVELINRGALLDGLASGQQSVGEFAKGDVDTVSMITSLSNAERGNKHHDDGYHRFPKVTPTEELGIVKRFEFVPRLQRMSVVVRDALSQQLYVYCKGAPEKILELSISSSIPDNALDTLDYYTRKGKRVIGFAGKSIGCLDASAVKRLDRDQSENGLTFLGLAVFDNQLNDDSKETIRLLKHSGCHCLMATGDNPLTAVAVAQESGIVTANGITISGDLPVASNSGVLWTKFEANGQSEASHNLSYFLQGRDIREVVFVLTGKAFHHLKTLHEKHQLQPAVIKNREESVNFYLRWRRLFGHLVSSPVSATALFTGDVSAHQASMPETMFNFSVCRRDDVGSSYEGLQGIHKMLNTKLRLMAPYDVTISTFEFILRNVVVFSRMSPSDKEDLVKSLKCLSTLIGMCGDASNDCQALKAADIGVSLSDAESSVAAPFTSTMKTVRNCMDVLREGRGALLNAFQIFKFIALYSIVQFMCVTTHYWFTLNYTDGQFLMIDLIAALPLSILISWTEVSNTLSSRLPPKSLVSTSVIISLFGHVIIQLAFILLIAILLTRQDFYIPFTLDPEIAGLASHANTVLFLFSSFQYPIVCVAISSRNHPWRRSVLTNIPLLVWLGILFVISIALTFTSAGAPAAPFGWLYRLLSLVDIPQYFRVIILCTALSDLILSVVFEYVIASWFVRRDESRTIFQHCIYAHPLPRDVDFDVKLHSQITDKVIG